MRSRFVVLLGALVTLAVIGATPVAAAKDAGGTYLALGDSVPAGTQQPAPFTDNGYPNVLLEKLERRYGVDELVNLACPADDSNEMLDGNNGPGIGSICYGENTLFPSGGDSQLSAALQYIQDNPGEVRLITLTIGANDLFLCGESDPPSCTQDKLVQWAVNLGINPLDGSVLPTGIIPQLRAAAPGVPIVAMNYYSPDLAFWLTTPEQFQEAYLTGLLDFAATGNGFIASTYGALGVPVVDVADAFRTFKTNGRTPKNVREVCELTLMCEKDRGRFVLSDYDPSTPGAQTDIHPSNSGHVRIAKAFDQLITKEKLLR